MTDPTPAVSPTGAASSEADGRRLRHDLENDDAQGADGLAEAVRDVDPDARAGGSGGEDATDPER